MLTNEKFFILWRCNAKNISQLWCVILKFFHNAYKWKFLYYDDAMKKISNYIMHEKLIKSLPFTYPFFSSYYLFKKKKNSKFYLKK